MAVEGGGVGGICGEVCESKFITGWEDGPRNGARGSAPCNQGVGNFQEDLGGCLAANDDAGGTVAPHSGGEEA